MIVVWKWEQKTPSGRWRRLRWAMTEEEAATYQKNSGAELCKVEGSREERQDVSGRPMPPEPYRPT